jgi:hypothetical protein
MRARTRLFVPEVVQTSAMDCGPAALKCLLERFLAQPETIPPDYWLVRPASSALPENHSFRCGGPFWCTCATSCQQLKRSAALRRSPRS